LTGLSTAYAQVKGNKAGKQWTCNWGPNKGKVERGGEKTWGKWDKNK